MAASHLLWCKIRGPPTSVLALFFSPRSGVCCLPFRPMPCCAVKRIYKWDTARWLSPSPYRQQQRSGSGRRPRRSFLHLLLFAATRCLRCINGLTRDATSASAFFFIWMMSRSSLAQATLTHASVGWDAIPTKGRAGSGEAAASSCHALSTSNEGCTPNLMNDTSQVVKKRYRLAQVRKRPSELLRKFKRSSFVSVRNH